MKLIHRILKTGLELSPDEKREIEESRTQLADERGKLRDIVQSLDSGQRLMMTWDDANRILNNRGLE